VTLSWQREVQKVEKEFTTFLRDFVTKDIFGKLFQGYRRLAGYGGVLYAPEQLQVLK